MDQLSLTIDRVSGHMEPHAKLTFQRYKSWCSVNLDPYQILVVENKLASMLGCVNEELIADHMISRSNDNTKFCEPFRYIPNVFHKTVIMVNHGRDNNHTLNSHGKRGLLHFIQQRNTPGRYSVKIGHNMFSVIPGSENSLTVKQLWKKNHEREYTWYHTTKNNQNMLFSLFKYLESNYTTYIDFTNSKLAHSKGWIDMVNKVMAGMVPLEYHHTCTVAGESYTDSRVANFCVDAGESCCYLLSEIAKHYKTDYFRAIEMINRSLWVNRSVSNLGNWQFKRFCVDLAFICMITGYGKVTYFNRKIPPSKFLKNLLKNVELNVGNFSTKATGLKFETLKEDDLKVIGLDSVSRVSEYIEDLNNLGEMSKEKRKQMVSDLDKKKTKVVGKKKVRALVESQMEEVKKYKSIVQQSSFEKKVVIDSFKDEHKKFNFIIDEFPLMLGSLPKDVKEKLKTADPKSGSEIKKNLKRSYIDVLTESDTVISDFGPYTKGERATGKKMFESSIDCCKKLIRIRNQNQRMEIKKSIINEKKKVISEEVKKLTDEIAENLRKVPSHEGKAHFKTKKEICSELEKQCEEWDKERKEMKEKRAFLKNRFKILEKLGGPEEFEKVKDFEASCYLNTIILIRKREKKEDRLNKLVKCNYLTPVGGPFNLYKKNDNIEGDKSIVKDNSFTRSLKKGQEISLRFKGKGNKNKTLKWKEKSGRKRKTNKKAERASIIEKTKTELLGKTMDKMVNKTFLKVTREMRVRENIINRNRRVEQHKGNILPLGKMLREILKILKIKGMAPNNLMTLGGTDYRSCLEEIDEEVARISARYLKIKLVE